MRDFEEIKKITAVKVTNEGPDGGAFDIAIGKQIFCVVASFALGWHHVSASIYGAERCPRWHEMCHIKDLFFEEDETVIQYHPKKSNYVNNHPYVLHLWKPQQIPIPTPPIFMV